MTLLIFLGRDFGHELLGWDRKCGISHTTQKTSGRTIVTIIKTNIFIERLLSATHCAERSQPTAPLSSQVMGSLVTFFMWRRKWRRGKLCKDAHGPMATK